MSACNPCNQLIKGYPELDNGMNGFANALKERVSSAASRSFARMSLSGGRYETVAPFSHDFSTFLLMYYIQNQDRTTIQSLQQKDPRVTGVLVNIFMKFLRDECYRGAEFILDNLTDIAIRSECMFYLGLFYEKAGDFSMASKIFADIYQSAIHIDDDVKRTGLLIRVGRKLVILSMNFFNGMEVMRNILIINQIILSLPFFCEDRAVFISLSRIPRALIAGNFAEARAYANEIANGELRNLAMEKIRSFETHNFFGLEKVQEVNI